MTQKNQPPANPVRFSFEQPARCTRSEIQELPRRRATIVGCLGRIASNRRTPDYVQHCDSHIIISPKGALSSAPRRAVQKGLVSSLGESNDANLFKIEET